MIQSGVFFSLFLSAGNDVVSKKGQEFNLIESDNHE